MTGDLSLVLPFDTDEPEFSRGVEVGMIWARLDHEYPVHATVRAENAEMVMRIAEARGLSFAAEPLSDDWLAVTLGAAPSKGSA